MTTVVRDFLRIFRVHSNMNDENVYVHLGYNRYKIKDVHFCPKTKTFIIIPGEVDNPSVPVDQDLPPFDKTVA